MGAFDRNRLPDWHAYADRQGLTLHGRGKWLSTACAFHDDSAPSLRVNVETGGWVCMACGTKGGDTLAHYMQLTGADFATAAKALGCWDERAQTQARPLRPTTLSARDAMEIVAFELGVLLIVISDALGGVLPNEADWQRFIVGAGRVQRLAEEYRA